MIRLVRALQTCVPVVLPTTMVSALFPPSLRFTPPPCPVTHTQAEGAPTHVAPTRQRTGAHR